MKCQRPIISCPKLNPFWNNRAQLWRKVINSKKRQCHLQQSVKVAANVEELIGWAGRILRPSDFNEHATVTP